MYRDKYSSVLEMKKVCLAKNGFTLIELMVTVALIVIMLMLATPSMITFQRNAELTSFANSMLAGINTARGEAMKRGRYAMVVPTDGTNWNNGWVVFVYVRVNTTTWDRAATDINILTREASPSYLTITPKPNTPASDTPPYIMFDASGYSKSKAGAFGALNLTIARNDVASSDFSQTRRVVIASTGRVKICTPTSATDANCLP